MNRFDYYNPVQVHFGNGISGKLEELFLGKYKRYLLVCAKGPFRENGLYEKVQNGLRETGAQVFVMSDIDSNPKLSSVYEGIKVVTQNEVDCVVALGGGSAMDCSKLIAMSSKTGIDPYDYIWGTRPKATDAVDTIMIPTIAATGTEMNNSCVIVNEETKEKYWCETMFPNYCIMDPEITMSIPLALSLWGAMDILSHTFEFYFNGNEDSEFQLGFSEAIITATMRAIEKLVINPHDIVARGEIMWCSTMTWGSGLTKVGRGDPDMTCHSIEESFSGYFDTHHGGCLGILTTRWMRTVMLKKPDVFARFARNVMGIHCADIEEAAILGVDAYIRWLDEIGAPQVYTDLSETVKFSDKELMIVAQNAWRIYKGKIGRLYPMSLEDIQKILMMGKEPLGEYS